MRRAVNRVSVSGDAKWDGGGGLRGALCLLLSASDATRSW